jgi:CheY-like chemotaxis protein
VVQALALLGSQEFDVIILDLNIPLGRDAPDELIDGHLNGKHVVTYLDKEQRLPALRVLCLTNFYERARNELGDKAVIVKKGTFVADFLRAVFP